VIEDLTPGIARLAATAALGGGAGDCAGAEPYPWRLQSAAMERFRQARCDVPAAPRVRKAGDAGGGDAEGAVVTVPEPDVPSLAVAAEQP
jgi:hypothetical protein